MSKRTHVVRTYDEEMSYIKALNPYSYEVKVGMVPHMNVPGVFYANDKLRDLVCEELQDFSNAQSAGSGGFLPAVKQIANVAALPGIVKKSIALPDVHSGYGFAIGKYNAIHILVW
jgi:tRNA-splicing ligase RtcB